MSPDMTNLEDEIVAVYNLGQKIGFGNMMNLASSIWRVIARSKGNPVSGVFDPVLPGEVVYENRAHRDRAAVKKAVTDENIRNVLINQGLDV